MERLTPVSAKSSRSSLHISDIELPMEPHPKGEFCLPRKDYLFKILVIGEFGVGKTSIIRRFTEGIFSANYKLTIGVDFALKVRDWDTGTRVSLQLWDIAGHERFGHMTSVYYKYAMAAVIVFDLTRPATFEAVTKWLDDLHSKVMLSDERPIPCLLLANKCDQTNVHIDTEMLNEYCRENGFLTWFPTSAKENTNIAESLDYLTHYIMAMSETDTEDILERRITTTQRHVGISIRETSAMTNSRSSCCGS